jgi:hypothetical protein
MRGPAPSRVCGDDHWQLKEFAVVELLEVASCFIRACGVLKEQRNLRRGGAAFVRRRRGAARNAANAPRSGVSGSRGRSAAGELQGTPRRTRRRRAPYGTFSRESQARGRPCIVRVHVCVCVSRRAASLREAAPSLGARACQSQRESEPPAALQLPAEAAAVAHASSTAASLATALRPRSLAAARARARRRGGGRAQAAGALLQRELVGDALRRGGGGGCGGFELVAPAAAVAADVAVKQHGKVGEAARQSRRAKLIAASQTSAHV